MAIHRFLLSILNGSDIPLYGDGLQTRDFTYVADIVDGTIRAATQGKSGGIYNLGGGHRLSIKELIELITRIGGGSPHITEKKLQPGDVRDTLADTSAASNDLGWAPKHSIKEGIKAEWEWLRECIEKGIIN
jgi:UDP-glucose 4-epimerase